jgi:hypothetical protein
MLRVLPVCLSTQHCLYPFPRIAEEHAAALRLPPRTLAPPRPRRARAASGGAAATRGNTSPRGAASARGRAPSRGAAARRRAPELRDLNAITHSWFYSPLACAVVEKHHAGIARLRERMGRERWEHVVSVYSAALRRHYPDLLDEKIAEIHSMPDSPHVETETQNGASDSHSTCHTLTNPMLAASFRSPLSPAQRVGGCAVCTLP